MEAEFSDERWAHSSTRRHLAKEALGGDGDTGIYNICGDGSLGLKDHLHESFSRPHGMNLSLWYFIFIKCFICTCTHVRGANTTVLPTLSQFIYEATCVCTRQTCYMYSTGHDLEVWMLFGMVLGFCCAEFQSTVDCLSILCGKVILGCFNMAHYWPVIIAR